MKQQIALRIEAGLLEQVRRCAADENRTMTNFIETVLKREVGQVHCASNNAASPDAAHPQAERPGKAAPRRRPPKAG